MFQASLVILTHSFKIPQLKQMMRFFHERETLDDVEIVLVSQDQLSGVEKTLSTFDNVVTFSLDLKTYNRPKMANFGVKNAKSDKVVLLDDDIIFLPKFISTTLFQLRKNTFYTADQILYISDNKYDDDIRDCNFSGKYQLKSIENTVDYPNLFSGSTFFFKDDYLKIGGMDESFVGYGYNDADMTQNVMENDIKVEFLNSIEFHLYHERPRYDGLDSVRNGVKFLKKWEKHPSKRFQQKLDQFKHEINKTKFL